MARAISFALTEAQFLDGSKTVTRRLGWRFLAPGETLIVVRKAMGLKRGEKRVLLGTIYVNSVRRERLDAITCDECAREGFAHLTPGAFVEFFCRAHRCQSDEFVTRIEFERLS